MDMSPAEAIAMGVAVLMALALVSFLAHARMSQGGVDAPRRRQVLTSLWLLVLGLIALLFALRAVSGGPVVAGGPSTGLWLGLQPRQVAALALALVLLIAGYARLRGILATLEVEPPRALGPDMPAPPVDEEKP